MLVWWQIQRPDLRCTAMVHWPAWPWCMDWIESTVRAVEAVTASNIFFRLFESFNFRDRLAAMGTLEVLPNDRSL